MTKTSKTVSLMALICLLLVAILFAYRAHQPNTVYATDNATIFPVGRDIKSFQLQTADLQPFTRKDFLGHTTLLFFGFTHCSNVCPTTLSMLSDAYPALINIKPNVKVVFVSLDPVRDDPQQLHDYTKHFHDEFVSVTGKINELHKLQADLHIYSEKENLPSSGNNQDYQIQHTSSILLINPQGKWVGLFSYGMNTKKFVKEFEGAVARMSA